MPNKHFRFEEDYYHEGLGQHEPTPCHFGVCIQCTGSGDIPVYDGVRKYYEKCGGCGGDGKSELVDLNIIYLDIDSVLNNYAGHCKMMSGDNTDIINFERHGDYVQKELLTRLHRIIKSSPPVKVVLITSWCDVKNPSHNIKVADFLGVGDLFFGTTDNTGGGMGRVRSVERHIKNYKPNRYVVIDDIPYFQMSDITKPVHIFPERDGLTDLLADKAIEILNK